MDLVFILISNGGTEDEDKTGICRGVKLQTELREKVGDDV